MFKVPMDVFTYTNEAAAMARGGRLVYANAAAKELLGADCEGKSLGKLLGPDISAAQASNFVADFSRGGKLFSVRATKQEEGQFFFFSKQEVHPEVLNEAFLYSMRSNLMNMKLALELCRVKAEEQGSEELLAQLREISRSQFRMSRMTSNLSMLKDHPDGEGIFNPVMLDIGRLCRECVDCVAELVEGVEFRINAQDGLYIMADALLVKRLLTNLISNSLVHAAGLSRINVNVIDSPDYVMISVSDDGCGIKPEQLHWVFDRYRHVYDMAEMNSGAGIGLSVVRIIAQRHGGTMLMESRVGSGTTTRVSLRKDRNMSVALHSGEEEHFDMVTALVELSDCLDSKYYGEKFMD